MNPYKLNWQYVGVFFMGVLLYQWEEVSAFLINPLGEQILLCVADLHLSMLEAFCNLSLFCCIFYHRSASPNNGFMILNRLGLNNQIEPITKDLEFQLQDPFLLYRNSKGQWLEPHIASADSFNESFSVYFRHL